MNPNFATQPLELVQIKLFNEEESSISTHSPVEYCINAQNELKSCLRLSIHLTPLAPRDKNRL